MIKILSKRVRDTMNTWSNRLMNVYHVVIYMCSYKLKQNHLGGNSKLIPKTSTFKSGLPSQVNQDMSFEPGTPGQRLQAFLSV